MSRGRPWTPPEDAVLLRMTAARDSQRRIAEVLERPLSSIPSRLDRLSQPRPGPDGQRVFVEPSRPAERKERKCLNCHRPFVSTHCMNRLCGTCRRASASPFDL